MNHRILIPLSIIVGMIVGLTALASNGAAPIDSQQENIRIGTYDSRAIAVAYAASAFNPVGEKMKAYEKAKAAGDQAAVRELEAWGERHQQMLHFQGFGRVPVDDLLEPVREKLAGVAADRKVAAIVMACDYSGEEVELVDVTDDLVALYEPNERTLTSVKNIRAVKPVPLPDLTEPPPGD